MNFQKEQWFHIYNQGNNRSVIFFEEHHYQYFKWKMRAYLKPFGDIISYCLMPNHFHIQFYVRKILVPKKDWREHVYHVETQRRTFKFGEKAFPVKKKSFDLDSQVTINQSFGVMLSSYSQAINKEMERSGSLFRKRTKAKSDVSDEIITLLKSNNKQNLEFFLGKPYAQLCFEYIHTNPVKAGLVRKPKEWKHSSFIEYEAFNNMKMNVCNVGFGKKFIYSE